MQYDGLAWLIALLAVVVITGAARLLMRPDWILGWLRGMAGLALLLIAFVLVMIAADLQGYMPLPENKPIATVSFVASAPKHYTVTILEGASEHSYDIEGDLWQLDVRLLSWRGLPALIGLRSGYRLQNLSGRYKTLEQQTLALHLDATLSHSPFGIDLWQWLRHNRRDLYLFDAQPARVSYLPMAPDAVYSISLAATGLVAVPVNQAAAKALEEW